MSRQGTPDGTEGANRETRSPDDVQQRRDAQLRSATQPASGAPAAHALAGAELAAEGRALDGGETAESLKRAAENDGRV